jgi:hypothetical protein
MAASPYSWDFLLLRLGGTALATFEGDSADCIYAERNTCSSVIAHASHVESVTIRSRRYRDSEPRFEQHCTLSKSSDQLRHARSCSRSLDQNASRCGAKHDQRRLEALAASFV